MISAKRIYYPMIFAAIFLSFLSLICYGGEDLFSTHVGENCWKNIAHLVAVVLLYDALAITLLIPSAVLYICETNLGSSFHDAVINATYIFVLPYMAFRYLTLKSFASGHSRSWASCFSGEWRIKVVISLLTVAFAVAIMVEPFLNPEMQFSKLCFSGAPVSKTFGIIQYSKLLFELLAVFVYSIGAPAGFPWWCLRMTSLSFIFVGSIIIIVLDHQYRIPCMGTLLPYILDCEVAFRHLELCRTSYIPPNADHYYLLPSFARTVWPLRQALMY